MSYHWATTGLLLQWIQVKTQNACYCLHFIFFNAYIVASASQETAVENYQFCANLQRATLFTEQNALWGTRYSYNLHELTSRWSEHTLQQKIYLLGRCKIKIFIAAVAINYTYRVGQEQDGNFCTGYFHIYFTYFVRIKHILFFLLLLNLPPLKKIHTAK